MNEKELKLLLRYGLIDKRKLVILNNILKYGKITCELCGKPTRRSKGKKYKYRITIDHIVPISKGGTSDVNNLQVAHRICNELKGDNL